VALDFFKKFVFLCFLVLSRDVCSGLQSNVIICGICKNVENSLSSTIENIKLLGSKFHQYRVVVYENNSEDLTKTILAQWARWDKNVLVISEDLDTNHLTEGFVCFDCNGNSSRMERIAKARNRILQEIFTSQFDAFGFVIMVDLDFQKKWPIDEIVHTIHVKGDEDWDAITANGIRSDGIYYDRFAFRNEKFLLGPELLGETWWREIEKTPLRFDGDHWIPVFSAFGGLAIYKKDSIRGCFYSGSVTENLRVDYGDILSLSAPINTHIQEYIHINYFEENPRMGNLPILFIENSGYSGSPVCCEHVTFHADMRQKGNGKIFINPKMFMHY